MPPIMFLRLTLLLAAGQDFLPEWARRLWAHFHGAGEDADADVYVGPHWLERYGSWLISAGDPMLQHDDTPKSIAARIHAAAKRDGRPVCNDSPIVVAGHNAYEVIAQDTRLLRACLYWFVDESVAAPEFRYDMVHFGAVLAPVGAVGMSISHAVYRFDNPSSGAAVVPVRSRFLTGAFSCLDA